MTSPAALTMTIFFVPLSTFTPTKPNSFCNKLKPAKSPSFILEISKEVDPVLSGPIVRWINVFFACTKLASILPIFKRKYPLRSLRDHNELSGLWFHCQTKGNALSFFLRLKSSDAAIDGIKPLLGGKSKYCGTFPFSPKTGQPSSHLTGTM